MRTTSPPWSKVIRECTCGRAVLKRPYTLPAISPLPSTSSSSSPSSSHPPLPLDKPTRKADWKRRQEGSNFVDTMSLNVYSGKGGSGGVSFHREKFKAKGPPSGGPGGAGGSVYLLATTSVTSLSHLPRTIRGGPGSPGGGKWLGGKRGEDMIVRVPVGTVVRELGVREGVESEWEREREERKELEWAWEASKVRLGEAERREKRWVGWKKRKEKAEKSGEDVGPFEELEDAFVEEGKQEALERVRKALFVTYPLTDLASHPSFLFNEHQLLSKLLSKEMSIPGKKTRRRRLCSPTLSSAEEEELLHLDLTKPTPIGEPILLVEGGKPGLGNPSFQSTEDRSPKYALKGGEGEMMRLELEVKAGGEVGLVGMPNAGKSTILRALTSSTPKVANYAFTTLNPHHGTCVIYSDSTFSGPRDATPSSPSSTTIEDTLLQSEYFSASTPTPTPTSTSTLSPPSNTKTLKKRKEELFRFTLTDNPGLVPNSSLNIGLGHSFLRHIERSPILIYVVDLSGKDPVEDLRVLRRELREYERMRGIEGLLGRVKGVVGNKADLFGVVIGGEEEGEGEGEVRRRTEDDGRKKLSAIQEYLDRVEVEDVSMGYRRNEEGDKIWLIPVSAKRRENVSILVERLMEGVKEERRKVVERIREEERREEEERERALEGMVMRR